MVNVGSGCGCSIKYAGVSGGIEAKLTTTNEFHNGDNMLYVGYVTIGGQSLTSMAVEQSQYVSQYVTLQFIQNEWPVVQTLAATEITSYSANLNGNVVFNGDATITARGFFYGTSADNLNNNAVSVDMSNHYNVIINGLASSTTYYYCAYALNSTDTIVGEVLSFTSSCECGGSYMVADIDGNQYSTILIGEQCWMAENLRTTKFADGTIIPLTDPGYYYASCTYPNNDSCSVATYGYLYNWQAVMHGSGSSDANPSNVQGICPNGWHLPSDAEWTQLTDYLSSDILYQCGGATDNIAKSLAFTSGWESTTETCAVGNAQTNNNSTGFSAKPAGRMSHNNGASAFGSEAVFWSSTKNPEFAETYIRYLNSFMPHVVRSGLPRDFHYCSVRCVKKLVLSVTTSIVNGITTNTAISGGDVTSDGGSAVTARGVCWSTSPNPTTSGNHTIDGTGIGSFSSFITGLSPSTTYYVRAYATNSIGTTYGVQMSFATPECNCGGSYIVTDIDGNQYGTVQIGEQCWMAQNLRTTKFADGTSISLGSSSSSTTAYRYYPNNSSNNVSSYGYLYNWSAVMHGFGSSDANPSNVQGICPNGWHIPSNAEWEQLSDYLTQSECQCGDNVDNIAKSLASISGWNSSTTTCAVGNIPANNNCTGFGARPAGNYDGSFRNFGKLAFFWSATQRNNSNAYFSSINYDYATISSSICNKYDGRSVRCIKDGAYESSVPSEPSVTTTIVNGITSNAAIGGGNVTSNGGATITSRGVCWSTSQNPTISDNHTTDGSGTGSFTSNITGLTLGTTYYVRAYATNSAGTSYGGQKMFTTMNIPTVITSTASNISDNIATLSGNVTSNGGTAIIERGFLYGISANNLTQNIQSGSGMGSFTANITGLSYNTTYYYKAYATNSVGTCYGEIMTFTTTAQTTGTANGHIWVDLGLPSGTLWATCNIGANNPEDCGNYYAWGETVTKSSYTEANYSYSNNPATLPASADAAAASWGSSWRMPTVSEMQELLNYCTLTWVNQSGVDGCLFIGTNGNSIFLPAAGDFYGSELYNVGSVGYYWSSNRSGSYAGGSYASGLLLESNHFEIAFSDRYSGHPVRPVVAE